MTGRVNVASANLFRYCVKALVYIHGHSCYLGSRKWLVCKWVTTLVKIYYLMANIWPLGIFLPLDLPSHLISRSVLPLKFLKYIWGGDSIIAKHPFICDQNRFWIENKCCHPLSCISDMVSCTPIASELALKTNK